MTKSEFNRRVKALGLNSTALPAARDVLVNGSTLYAAQKAHGGSFSNLHRVVRLIESARCPRCGHPI